MPFAHRPRCESVEAVDGRLAQFEGQLHTLASMLNLESSSDVEGANSDPMTTGGTKSPTRRKRRHNVPDASASSDPESAGEQLARSAEVHKQRKKGRLGQKESDEDFGSRAAEREKFLPMDGDWLYPGAASLDSVKRPPRHVLHLFLHRFTCSSQCHSVMDIFDVAALEESVTRVYSQDTYADSPIWALCFNLMVLLGLGLDSPETPNTNIYLKPYIGALETAINSIHFLLVPEMVNMQTLVLMVWNSFVTIKALLLTLLCKCIASQNFCARHVADAVFSRTCALAKTMGVHRPGVIPDQTCGTTPQQRQKLFDLLKHISFRRSIFTANVDQNIPPPTSCPSTFTNSQLFSSSAFCTAFSSDNSSDEYPASRELSLGSHDAFPSSYCSTPSLADSLSLRSGISATDVDNSLSATEFADHDWQQQVMEIDSQNEVQINPQMDGCVDLQAGTIHHDQMLSAVFQKCRP